RLRDLIVRGELLALSPDFMLVELANVLRFARGLSKVDIVNAVRAVIAVGVELRGFLELVDRAAGIALERGLTIYDAAYAALAELEGAKLVTYDRELLGKLDYAVTAGALLPPA
ncbi:MAG: PIN domain-containing protein, partial [Thermofilaceae archaeon]